MGFSIAKLLGLLLQPSLLLLLCAAAGLLLHSAALAWVGVGGLLAIVVLPINQWAARPLEEAVPRPPDPPRVDGILVLGGAVREDVSADRQMTALNAAAERMTEAVVLARRYPEARIVFTGGSGRLLRRQTSEAEQARRLFDALGVPEARVVYESASRTTWENAALTRKMVVPAPGEVWLLVTSALHMPRALRIFAALGWNLQPWAVAYRTRRSGLRWFEAPGERIAGLDVAAHEWLGLLACRLTIRPHVIPVRDCNSS